MRQQYNFHVTESLNKKIGVREDYFLELHLGNLKPETMIVSNTTRLQQFNEA